MAKKFGAAVSILMVCPIGTSAGEIELRRYVSQLTVSIVVLTYHQCPLRHDKRTSASAVACL